MDAYIKSFATYRTIKKVTVISSSLVVDSLEADGSSVTVRGSAVGRSDTGNWLIIDTMVFRIANVKPQSDRTIITLTSPLEAFNRALELNAQEEGQTIGGFILAALNEHWITQEDAAYALRYLKVSNSDTTAFVAPVLGSNNCFVLSEYCRLMRKGYGVSICFSDAGSYLSCVINKYPAASRQISFTDGRSQLQSVDYSASGIAKLTVLCEEETDDVVTYNRSVWYLSEAGEISQEVPARRAAGEWSTILVKGEDNIAPKVVETFAKNKANHKLEFWSTIDLNVQDNCTFFVYGEQLQSYISYKRKSSEDKRYYYKSGELATTATEKLRGVKHEF